MSDCIFCKIITREIPADISYEDNDLIVFQSLANTPLIVPKKHLADIFELDHETGNQVMDLAIKISPIIKKIYSADGIFVMQNNGAASGQEVFHYHMHIIPKWTDKRSPATTPEAKKSISDQIKTMLAS